MLLAYIKAFHVIAIIAWMAGLLYLPRLFVYHAASKKGSEQSETFQVMERRLLRYITTPAMLASWVLGLILAITDPAERRMAETEELAYTMETVRDSHERGLMWGWAHSKHFTDLGSTHRFDMWPISPELFEAAKAVGWDVDALTDETPRRELEAAWQGYRTHMMKVVLSGDQP